MCPFLMNMNNQFVHQSSKTKNGRTKHDPKLDINSSEDTSYIPNSIMSQEHDKKTSPFTSMAKCYQEQILVAQQELPIMGV
jgi:hypothetical protein